MEDHEIKRLIALRSEGPNLDYKGGFAWTKENRDHKYELVRDLIALSNTKDGGRIIFGVRDDDLAFVGVASEVFESIDPTSVLQTLHDNSAPKAQCAVFKREIEGKRVVVFDVAEFEDTPTICTNTITGKNDPSRVLLRHGAIYVRTQAARTEEVSAADDMRALLSRAIRRRADELLHSIRELMTGRPKEVGPDSAVLFAAEIRQADEFLQRNLAKAWEKGRFEVVAHPTVYDPKRVASLPETRTAVTESSVQLRGWDFPHVDRDASPFNQGFQSTTIWERTVEGFRLYQSGLFVWKSGFWEDIGGKQGGEGQPLLSFISTIWAFTEFHIFLSRLYERVAPDATVRLRVTMVGCDKRDLAAFDHSVSLPWQRTSHEDTIIQEREVSVVELRASHLEIAREMVAHVLHVFGWLDASEHMIEGWQTRLLKRQLF